MKFEDIKKGMFLNVPFTEGMLLFRATDLRHITGDRAITKQWEIVCVDAAFGNLFLNDNSRILSSISVFDIDAIVAI